MSQVIFMSRITCAAALENKHSGLLFEVVMLPYTSSEYLVISPYSAVCIYLIAGKQGGPAVEQINNLLRII